MRRYCRNPSRSGNPRVIHPTMIMYECESAVDYAFDEETPPTISRHLSSRFGPPRCNLAVLLAVGARQLSAIVDADTLKRS